MPSLTTDQQDRLRSVMKRLGFRADQNEPVGGHLSNFVRIVDFDKISARNAQIIFGRNGTGKTHLFQAYAEYCAADFGSARRLPIYVDCRRLDIRSLGGEISIEHLLKMFYKRLVGGIAEEIDRFARAHIDVGILERLFGGTGATRQKNIAQAVAALGTLLDEGTIERRIKSYVQKLESEASGSSMIEGGIGASIKASEDNVHAAAEIKVGGNKRIGRKTKKKIETLYNGLAVLDYEAIRSQIEVIAENAGADSVIILLDEWSDMPRRIQPIIAEMIRKTLGISQRITVKIGALKFYCWTSALLEGGDRIGLRRGIDISTLEDLDALLCFESQEQAVKDFLTLVLYKHAIAEDASLEKLGAIVFEEALCEIIFGNVDAYKDLVRASEGNPRDFLRLLFNCLKSVEVANGKTISAEDVTTAVIRHFQNEKMPELVSNAEASDVFDGLYELVIQKSSKVFLVRSPLARNHPILQELWHYRFIHLVAQNVPYIKENTPIEYDVFSLDYGKLVAIKLQKGGEERLKLIERAGDLVGEIAGRIASVPLGNMISFVLRSERVAGALRRMFGAMEVRRKGIEKGNIKRIEELVENGCIADAILHPASRRKAAAAKEHHATASSSKAKRK
jgi:hypothetical protein